MMTLLPGEGFLPSLSLGRCLLRSAVLTLLLGTMPSCGPRTASSDPVGGGGSAGTDADGAAIGMGGFDVDASYGDADARGALAPGSGESGGSDAPKIPDGSAEVSDCDTPMTVKPLSTDLDLIDGRTPDWSWWVVTGQPDAGTLTFMPPASPPAPTPSAADGRTFLQLAGSGLRFVDYGLLGFDPSPSLAGGEPSDLSDAPGLTFDAKGSNAWIVINTVDVVPRFCRCSGADCAIGYRYRLPVTETWTSYTVTWDRFDLPPYVVNRPTFDPKNITTISFGGLGSDFDVFVDNLRLAPANSDAGAEAQL